MCKALLDKTAFPLGIVSTIGSAIAVTGGMMFATIFESRSAALFLLNISLLQIAWIALGCYLYSALIHYNNLLVPAATSLSSFGSAFGAGAVGFVLEHGGVTSTLILTTGALALTAMLTIPVLIRARQMEKAIVPNHCHARQAGGHFPSNTTEHAL